jgi:hypothetical protein
MEHYILTGAGFSANWGGWVSSEFWQRLIAKIEDESLRHWLEGYRSKGFETALFDAKKKSEDESEWKNHYKSLISITNSLFEKMNSRLISSEGVDSNNELKFQKFFGRFDAVFTTNQDLLVESRFGMNLMSGGLFRNKQIKGNKQNKRGWYIPGLKIKPYPPGNEPTLRENPWIDIYCPDNNSIRELKEQLDCVPYVKLHGSSNFETEDGSEIMILGGEKEEQIQETPLMNFYFKILRDKLFSPNSRILIVGHSLSDVHINKIIFEAIEKYRLRFYLWTPENVDALKDRLRSLEKEYKFGYTEELWKQGYISENHTSLKEMLTGDMSSLETIEEEFFNM